MPYPNVNTLDDLNQAIDQYARSPKQPPLKGEELNFILKKMVQLTGAGALETFDAEVQQGAISIGDQVGVGTLPALSETIRLMLKTSVPTLTNPAFELSHTSGTLRRVGEVVDVSLRYLFDRGSIFQSWNQQQQNQRAGQATGYSFQQGPLQPSDTYSLSGYTIKPGLNTFEATVAFGDGPQPKDRKGDPFDHPYPGATIRRVTSFEGVYPIYATTANIQMLSVQPLGTQVNGWEYIIPLVAEQGGFKQSFWLPDYLEQIGQPIYQLQIYNAVSELFEDANKLTEFDISSSVQGALPGKRYIYHGPDRGALQIKIKSQAASPVYNTIVRSGEPSGAGILLLGTGDLQLKCNTPLPVGDPLPASMIIKIGNAQVGDVTFTTRALGQPCAIVYNGTIYNTTFQNTTINL